MLPALTLGLLLSASGDAEKGVIHVRSQGYSRFEIDGQNVVAYYTGGVEFTILDYELRADELRFNQATRQAFVDGTVQLRSQQISLDLPSLAIDADRGSFSAGGGVTGSLNAGKIMFSAGRLSGTIASQQSDFSTESLDLELSEGVILAYGPAARLTTSSLRYSSQQGRLFVPAGFELAVDPRLMQSPASAESQMPNAVAGLLAGPMTLSGSSMEGTFNSESGALTARVVEPAVIAQDASLSGDIATLDIQRHSGTPEQWAIAFSGTPAVATAALNAVPVTLQAASVTMTSGQTGNVEAHLIGDVTTSIGSTGLTSESLVLTFSEQGLTISDSEGLRIGLDLRRQLNVDPVDVFSLGLSGVP